jgi:two-component system response regulator
MTNHDNVDILLVEDNPNDAELLLMAFRKHSLPYKVAVVRDGAEAIDFIFCTGAYATRHPFTPKLILLDLKLPLVSGLEVLARIKSDQEKKLIPVVVFSSSAEEQDILKSYQAGANSYIQKPVDYDTYTRTVTTIVSFWLQRNLLPLSVSHFHYNQNKAI